ncbi:acetate--CoA ligase family protein [Halomicroarcula limicola]|uniref:acetate--CoA ligase (ADP-forming) n=1 Tax=Haloarcula limicola TaxID=1429915 RepID=A0A8J7YEA1_9EURY|nr:acetate--CoA ligase [Halomicroarcula limicola]MBV0926314.1 acetate--CoA ligase family protein [Halomicroarcula limicola]
MAGAPTDIERIMAPDAVAVVGASTDETKRGHQAIVTLQEGGYEGDIYPVNPNAEEIRGLDVYPAVSAIPGRVDLALIVTPAHIVPSVLEDCAETDLAGAVVIAVGFSEAGENGEQLEAEIVSLAREHGIRLIGPNTSGMINVHRGLNLVGADTVPEGSLALLCQSGNMAISLFTEAATREGVGFSHYVGVGNEADLQFHEYLPFLDADPETDAIVCYVEGMSDGRAFLQAARDIVPETPIVVLKSGRSDVGKRSASSHTGSLAGDAAVTDAVLEQAGVVSVERSDELLSVANALSSLPRADSPNVGILADGGGHATLAADACSERGLSIPRLTDQTQERLQAVLPDAASVVNPVDVAGGTDNDQSVFVDCAAAIIADPNVDALMLTGLFGGYGVRFAEQYTDVEIEAARELASLAADHDTPLVVQSAYEGFDTEPHAVLREQGIPVVESLDVATASLSALATYGDRVAVADQSSDFQLPAATTDDTLADTIGNGRTQLSEFEAKRALADDGFPVTPFDLATSADEAAALAADIDGPVAMKVVSPDIVHKSDAGGVALNVGLDAAAATYEDLCSAAAEYDPDASLDGVLISPMRDAGVELIIGVVDDDQFGPVVMCGLGGVFVEVLEDIAFRALPLTEADARAMLDDIEAQELLDGARGNPPVDRDAVVDLLVAVSTFVQANPSVTELDLNPVFADADGVEIVDAAITLDEQPQQHTKNEDTESAAPSQGETDD